MCVWVGIAFLNNLLRLSRVLHRRIHRLRRHRWHFGRSKLVARRLDLLLARDLICHLCLLRCQLLRSLLLLLCPLLLLCLSRFLLLSHTLFGLFGDLLVELVLLYLQHIYLLRYLLDQFGEIVPSFEDCFPKRMCPRHILRAFGNALLVQLNAPHEQVSLLCSFLLASVGTAHYPRMLVRPIAAIANSIINTRREQEFRLPAFVRTPEHTIGTSCCSRLVTPIIAIAELVVDLVEAEG
mmetsp:Transcript_29621/g.67036  ORF Transcript_29621/g.67036 Transcript_29621/m.67036 type:complete len:238 (+) Transcript_29621:650-1363(+)